MPEPAIATPHADATAAGRRAFAAGGTAVDAALAAAAVLTVVYPHNCALGGDLFALVREPDGTITNINASGPAPAGADAGALRARGLDAMPITGPDTVTVPGLVAGWGALHERGGARPWAAALHEATAAAHDGVAVARSLGDALAEADLADPGMAAVFAPGGAALRTGQTLRQPALAATLRTLADGGPRAFYEGALAERLAAGARAAGCALTARDLAAFAAETAAPPLRAPYGDLEVLTSPPNSSGVLLLQALLALAAAAPGDPLGADAAVLAELLRGGGQDRDRLLGDPRSTAVDLDGFLGEERLAELVSNARAAARGERGAPVLIQRHERPAGDTVAVVATDGEGRAVSLIQSLFHGFGAGILEPATGVLLHNRGAFFSLRPGDVNELAPGRRPAHTLMPFLVLRDGELLGTLGTMGGRVHAQILAQVLLALRAGVAPQEAVDAPRWIVGGMELGEPDDMLRIEAGVPEAARGSLVAGRGADRVVDLPRDSEWLGHAQVVWAGAAGSDRRADGSAWSAADPG